MSFIKYLEGLSFKDMISYDQLKNHVDKFISDADEIMATAKRLNDSGEISKRDYMEIEKLHKDMVFDLEKYIQLAKNI